MSRRSVAAVTAAILAVGVFLAFPAQAQESKAKSRWEYRLLPLTGAGDKAPASLSWNGARAELDDERRAGGEHPTATALEAFLNRAGQDGWELVEHGDHYALFKRPAQ